MTPKPIARLAFLAGLLLAPACSQIIGIEDAHVDGTIGAREPGSSGSSAISGSLASPMAGAGAAAEPTHNHGGTNNTPATTNGGDDAMGGEKPDDSGVGGTPPMQGLCEQYCDKVTTNCKGKYEQYRKFDQCIEVCKRLPVGQPGDDNVNTLHCRMNQAQEAEGEPFLYCKSAGPLGAGRCGSNCISYCSLMQTACTAESTSGNLEASYFESSQACVENCNAIPEAAEGPTYYSSSEAAEPSRFVGNHVYCRTYHLAAALENDTPTEHCPHAMGGDPCIDE